MKNVLRDKKKRLIILTLIILLIEFCTPKSIQADWIEDAKLAMKQGLAEAIYWCEYGILKLMNNIFSDDDKEISGGIDQSGVMYLSPETVIKGKYLLMDANIFKDFSTATSNDYYDADSVRGGKGTLQSTIRAWYTALRNFAIVALLSILVYVGIRMMMTSISQDKAKYKTMFKDWVVAICLVVLMHYIMVGSLNLTSMITSAIGANGGNTNITENIMENINAGIADGTDEALGDVFGQEMVLLAVIIFTIIFVVKYVLRAITIIFLILLGPITAITYPIDKISDGKAQAFNMWFREFFYNVIIQPFHLLIYIVLLGSSSSLASESLLLTLSTCVSTAIFGSISSSENNTFIVFLPTPGIFSNSFLFLGIIPL